MDIIDHMLNFAPENMKPLGPEEVGGRIGKFDGHLTLMVELGGITSCPFA